jgi:1,4-dihydroxy-6-naphthoate synthase
MFWALATDKIDTGDRQYIHELADIETLNRRALRGELEVTAVSIHAYGHLTKTYALLPHGASMGIHAYGHLTKTYALLPHGASMGDRYGPRLVARTPGPSGKADVRQQIGGKRVAIPGELTTAFLALRLFQPDFEAVTVPFDKIEEVVESGEVDAGLLIHEGQLTYAGRGLHLWLDLGEWCLPLPLGGNVVRRDLGEDLIRLLSRDLRSSIVYGLEHRDEALEYALQFARGLDRSDADAFVGMYVNEYTVDYGERGRKAVRLLLDRAANAGFLPERVTVTFVDDGFTS